MATSTTTLLQAVNKVMLATGERQVSELTSYPAQKAVLALSQALEDLGNFNNWSFTRAQGVATTWSTDTATVSGMKTLYKVTFNSSSGARDLLVVPSELFPHNFTQAGTPSTYVQVDENQVKFSPYPDNATDKAAIIFHYHKVLTMPSVTTDVFPVPESYISCLLKGAYAYMHQLHLDDQTAFRTYYDAFMQSLINQRQRDISRAGSGLSMYRRGG